MQKNKIKLENRENYLTKLYVLKDALQDLIQVLDISIFKTKYIQEQKDKLKEVKTKIKLVKKEIKKELNNV